jgi:hypothetical protein
VYVSTGGEFILNGGNIADNSSLVPYEYNVTRCYGGGVYSSGTFTKNGDGGIIYGTNGGTNANTVGTSVFLSNGSDGVSGAWD